MVTEIRSVEHGICPIAEFTSPWLPLKNLTSPSCSPTPILVIRVHLRQILRFSFLHGISGPLGQKMEVLGGNRGRGGAILTPTNSFLHLRVYPSVSNLVKMDEEMRPWECPQTDRHTHTDAKRCIICPMLYAIAMGQIIITFVSWIDDITRKSTSATQGGTNALSIYRTVKPAK